MASVIVRIFQGEKRALDTKISEKFKHEKVAWTSVKVLRPPLLFYYYYCLFLRVNLCLINLEGARAGR